VQLAGGRANLRLLLGLVMLGCNVRRGIQVITLGPGADLFVGGSLLSLGLAAERILWRL
jgi:hypothetical protein